MTLLVWNLVALAVLGLLGFAAYRCRKQQFDRMAATLASFQPRLAAEQAPYKISYAPRHRVEQQHKWCHASKNVDLQTYEGLEDARYGLRIVWLTPIERKKERPHKTRTHGLKTVDSIVRREFLISDGKDGHVIADHGLNALEVCNVKY